MPRCRDTSGNLVGYSPHKWRANFIVQRYFISGAETPAMAQQACNTPRSNDALCAAMNSTRLNRLLIFGQSLPKLGFAATSGQVIPCKYEKIKSRLGGRIRTDAFLTILLFSTTITDIEQALSRP